MGVQLSGFPLLVALERGTWTAVRCNVIFSSWTHNLKLWDEISQWCSQYAIGHWGYGQGENFWFEDKSSAIRFKLTWHNRI